MLSVIIGMLIGLSGLAGVGKDTAADILVRDHSFTKVSLADPLKSICKEVFDFSYESLWGSSAERNVPDLRYGLSPRHALQTLGTWGRDCHPDIWIEMALRRVRLLSKAVIPDVRFRNEILAIRKSGGKLVRLVRPIHGLSGEAGQHVSETEQASIPDSEFDYILRGAALEELPSKVAHMLEELRK